MSLNIEGDGKAICLIESKDKKRKKIIYADDKDESMHPFCDFKCNPEEKLQQIFDPKREREIFYLTGASGSGKSHYASGLAQQYSKQYPNNDIYLFSAVKTDPILDKLKKLMRIDLTKFMAQDIDIEDFKDSLVVYDDCDSLPDKNIKKKVMGLQDRILQEGRHHCISCIVTSHLSCSGKETKMILSEAHSITFYPMSLQGRNLKYLLEQYMGLDRNQIAKIKKIKSRWITFCKTMPQVILSEKEVYVLNCE